MADLFDMNANGMGFHLTSHLIAIVALFVACFAITGYITYRDNSVPAGAIKHGFEFDDENITAASLTSLGTLTVNGSTSLGNGLTDTVSRYGFTTTAQTQTVAIPAAPAANATFTTAGFIQPANSVVSGLKVNIPAVISTANNAGTDILSYSLGTTAAAPVELVAATRLLNQGETTVQQLLDWTPVMDGVLTEQSSGAYWDAGTQAFAFAAPGAGGPIDRTGVQRTLFFQLIVGATGPVTLAPATTMTVTMYFTSLV